MQIHLHLLHVVELLDCYGRLQVAAGIHDAFRALAQASADADVGDGDKGHGHLQLPDTLITPVQAVVSCGMRLRSITLTGPLEYRLALLDIVDWLPMDTELYTSLV